MNTQRRIVLETPPLPHYIVTGLTTFRPGEQHPSRRNLGLYDLLWVVEGALYIGEDDMQWEVTRGQTLLLLPDRFHYAVKPCDTDTTFYWMHFGFGGASGQAESSSGPYYPSRNAWDNPYTIRLLQYASPPEFPIAERHLGKLLDYARKLRHDTFWQEQQLFMELLGLLDERFGDEGQSPVLKLAEKTEAYLRQHYQAPLTNERLSEALHFHPNYIVRCMKEIYRRTPMEYLHTYRMEQAKLLLVKTDWPVSKIAEHVGFQFAPYFSSCFKQYTGISPLKFRKQYAS
ncbi:helix-turn-helix transcriptional regulator [Cohnella sp. 56]|uniref:helix-turn-helix transcriptional regulator n=1 Tax=Cohnella sp. 56 TaxID=3113722 RepID=UPI0030E8F1D7